MWLALTNLLVEPRCRAKYGMDEFRRERLLGLKRHLNELLFDQVSYVCIRCVVARVCIFARGAQRTSVVPATVGLHAHPHDTCRPITCNTVFNLVLQLPVLKDLRWPALSEHTSPL